MVRISTNNPPGVYTQEVDRSERLDSDSTTALAFVGTALKGPVNKPVMLTNTEEAKMIFGLPRKGNDIELKSALMALESSNAVYFNNVAKFGGQPAALTVNKEGSDLPTYEASVRTDGNGTSVPVPNSENLKVRDSEDESNNFKLVVGVTNEGGDDAQGKKTFTHPIKLPAGADKSDVKFTKLELVDPDSTHSATVDITANNNVEIFDPDNVGGASLWNGDTWEGALEYKPSDGTITFDLATAIATSDNSKDGIKIIVYYTYTGTKSLKTVRNSQSVATQSTPAHDIAGDYTIESYDKNPDDGILFYVVAKSPGTWANTDVQIKIDDVEGNTFDFYVRSKISGSLGSEPDWNERVYRCSIGDVEENGININIVTQVNSQDPDVKIAVPTGAFGVPSPTYNVDDDGNIIPDINTGEDVVEWKSLSNGSSVETSPSDSEYEAGWNLYKEAKYNDIRVLVAAGCGEGSYSTMKNIAETRKDCVALFDVPYNDSNPLTGVSNWVDTNKSLKSSYVSLYSPWVNVRSRFNGEEFYMPPSAYAAKTIALTHSVENVWHAPAGVNRGGLSSDQFTYLGTQYSADQERAGSLYSKYYVNLIKTDHTGAYIWGQKTFSLKRSSLDRLNVRFLLIDLLVNARNILNRYVFELNTAETRARIVADMKQRLDYVKDNNGLYEYKLVCDTNNNTADVIDHNELVVDLYVKPVKAAEFIKLSTIIDRNKVITANIN